MSIRRFAAALGITATAVLVAAVTVPGFAEATRPIQEVFVANPAGSPVKATLEGAPPITIAPGSAPVPVEVEQIAQRARPEPYEAVVKSEDVASPMDCSAIPVPTGRMLRVDNVGVEVWAPELQARNVEAAGVRINSGLSFGLTHPVAFTNDGPVLHGQAEMTLLLGEVERPIPRYVAGEFCLKTAFGTTGARYVATITGELLAP